MSDVWVCEQTLVAAENRWVTACGYRAVPEPDQGWVVDLLTNGWFITGAYFAVALVLARIGCTVLRKRGSATELEGEEVGMVSFCALIWPLTALLAAGWWFATGGARKIDRRDDERRERAKKLRADAREWDDKRRTGTDAERQMAGQLAEMCREQADELEATR